MPSRTTSRWAFPISGAVALERAISTFARMAWCITARSSAAIRGFRWRNTQLRIYAASSIRRSHVLRIAPYRACIRCRWWTRGARPRGQRRHQARRVDWYTSSSCPLLVISGQRSVFRKTFPEVFHSGTTFANSSSLKLMADGCLRRSSPPRSGTSSAVPEEYIWSPGWRGLCCRYKVQHRYSGTCWE